MQIFPQEVKDGLAEKLASSSSLAFEIIPSLNINTKADINIDNKNQQNTIDLLYFNSILASVGWNLNDDVFDAGEMWKARNTPVNKKINYMHDESDIIGHMTSSDIIDFEGKFVSDDTTDENIPNKFDIVVGGYIYKYWSKDELKERMFEILDKVNKQELAVSMECIFPTFDYAVISTTGEQKIIPRTEDTAFLTKHLRIYGGKGSYEGFRVGRLLRKMVFTGNALVDRPANPRSLILKKDAQSFSGSLANINIFKTNSKIITEKKHMAFDISKEDYDALIKRVETAEATAKEASKKEIEVLKESNEKSLAEIKKLSGELEASKVLAKAHQDQSTTLADQIKTLEEALAKAKDEMAKCQKEMSKSKRKTAMASLDISEDEANRLADKFVDVSDEIFDELVKAMPKKTVKATETVIATTASVKEVLDKATDIDTNVNVVTETQNTMHAEAKAWFASVLSNKSDKGE